MENQRKTALITGGSRGLGKNMALSLAKAGYHLIITYHTNADAAKEVAKNVRKFGTTASLFQLDTRNVQSFEDFFRSVSAQLKEQGGTGCIDFLINNAGTALQASFAQTTEEQFDDCINIHFKGVFFLTQKALPYLNDGGRIVNISSGLSRVSFSGSSVYGSVKGAIDVFTRYLAKELGERKITANAVAPGAVATDFGNGSNRDNEQKRAIISGITALGGVGEPEDIGGVVAFLCSKEAGWINGQRIEVSGGMLL